MLKIKIKYEIQSYSTTVCRSDACYLTVVNEPIYNGNSYFIS